jgi:hypothetical protein
VGYDRDAFTRRMMDQIFVLGPKKPIGYLPFDTIRSCGFEIDDVRRDLEAGGIFTLTFPHGKIKGGALYAADLAALQTFIAQHITVIADAEWPSEPRAFLKMVHDKSVKSGENPALYRVIGMAFNDERFRT